MNFDRRELMRGLIAAGVVSMFGARAHAAQAGERIRQPFSPGLGPKSRVLFINDLCGDFDGLFAAAHAVLSPSIDLRGIVGTAAFFPQETASRSTALAAEMLAMMRAADRIKVYEGAAHKLSSASAPVRSPGTRQIIGEAMRTDTKLPLYVAVGGGLTEVASTLILEPQIAAKMTLVWIGGTSGNSEKEYNFSIDPIAAQYIFSETEVPIWQIPAEVYATCQVSDTELQAFVAPYGKIGAWLYAKALEGAQQVAQYKLNSGETWALGDSPLVLLTALSDWVPNRMGSNFYDEIPTPRVSVTGTVEPRPEARKMRLYKSVDTRLMFSDFYAKLAMNFGA
jgi:inosine-uridine nucleoside N-ribohydrolase